MNEVATQGKSYTSTAADIAANFNVRPAVVIAWFHAGRIPGLKLSHKILRFNMQDVVAALESPDPLPKGGA